MQIWEFRDYRSYMLERLGPEGSRSGLRKRLAEAIPVHTTFVSQVLKGRAEFSLEQAEAINTFLGHSDDEGEYFILLLMKDRAGSKPLKTRFERKIAQMSEQRLNVASRLKVDEKVSDQDRERYYSSHLYAAIHVLASVPGFQDVESLAKAFNLSRARTQDMIDFLIRIGLLKFEKEKLAHGPKHVHIDNTSELVLSHHRNWRMHAIQSLQFLDRDDLHFSACVSLSTEDIAKVKEILLDAIKRNVDVISASKEEVAWVLNIDFHKLLAK